MYPLKSVISMVMLDCQRVVFFVFAIHFVDFPLVRSILMVEKKRSQMQVVGNPILLRTLAMSSTQFLWTPSYVCSTKPWLSQRC